MREIENQRNALFAPVEESQRVAARLRLVIADAERSLSDLSHLFKAEQERVSRRCTERRDNFLAEAIPARARSFTTQSFGRTGSVERRYMIAPRKLLSSFHGDFSINGSKRSVLPLKRCTASPRIALSSSPMIS